LDSRLAIISGASFAGVVAAAALIAGLPGFVSGGDNTQDTALVALTGTAIDNAGSSSFAPALDTSTGAASAGGDTSEVAFTTGPESHEAAEHQAKDASHQDSHDDHDDEEDD
jgi:hypothetical protein